jgi:hypothetical protein
VKRGRPAKLRLKKKFVRKRYGAVKRGAKSPKQMSATMGRRRVRKARRR